jgi:parallel beta-helix repeat protein
MRMLILALGALALAACTTAAPQGASPAAQQATQQAAQPAPQQPVPAAIAALAGRISPCAVAGAPGTQPASAPATPAAPQSPDVANSTVVHYDHDTDTIVLRRGAQTGLAGISRAIERPTALRELAPGEWLLAANLRVEAGALLRIAAPEVRWLKLRSDDQYFVWIKALGGQLAFTDTCVSSWDAQHSGYDENHARGRSFVLARDGARMEIERSDLRYLGYDGPESYGIAWRTERTTGKIVDSFVSHNFYGIYSFEANDLLIRGNEVAHNIMYGIDPHTRSLRLVIENNVAHDNGKHGIILAEECSDGVVRGNVAYGNLHHGIVLFQRSNNNLVEGNTVYSNGGHGINVNDAANNTVRDNTAYDNLEAGIGVGQGARANTLAGNRVRENRRDGVSFYSEAAGNLLRDNTIEGNARYGVYLKGAGQAEIRGNHVAGNQVGVYLAVEQPFEISRATNQIQGNREADVRSSDDADAEAGVAP